MHVPSSLSRNPDNRKRCFASRAVITALGIGIAACGPEETATPDGGRYAPPGTPAELAIAGYAKVLCSAVFVSGRDENEALENSGFFFLAEADRDKITDVDVDRDRQMVHMTFGDSITRTAKFYGDQGCVIHPIGEDSVFFTPVDVRTTLPDPMTQGWPMGDVLSDDPLPAHVDQDMLAKAVETAFAEGLTAAFLVVHDGKIVAERYAPGIDKETQLESWSMGKSLTATLFARLLNDGLFDLGDPAPVAEWQSPDDPRSAITITDLLHMSSGLRFIATQDPDYTPDMGYPDHMYIYNGAIDAFQHSITRPLQFPPNSDGRYRNSDPLTIGYLIKQAVTARGGEYLTFPQRELFDKIGIRKQVLEPDPYGNFLLTGYDYGTARNWARLGLLYLQDGMWEGQRLLPEDWVDFVRTPAPAWARQQYGGLFWLNRIGEWNLPDDTYFMSGGGGQRTFIVPSMDLVVVRLGHFRGNSPGMRKLNEALGLLMEAFRALD